MEDIETPTKTTQTIDSSPQTFEFHDCESSVSEEFDQEHILCHDDSVPETFNPQASTSPNRCENNDTVLSCDTIELIKTINPTTDFPIPSHEIWNSSRCAKAGAICTVVWAFDRNTDLNVSAGKVTRNSKAQGKVNLIYTGIHGYMVGEEFRGSLPPIENIRIYRIIWQQNAPSVEISSSAETLPNEQQCECTAQQIAFQENLIIPNNASGNIDYEPIPTLRSFTQEMIPCVVATYRDILHGYIESDFPQRTSIWHCLLSAMKLSLAAARVATGRARRRRPTTKKDDETQNDTQQNANENKEEHVSDKRAIKRATRLALEGCASKAAKVLDREFKKNELSNEETLSKLKELHPQEKTCFPLPSDALKLLEM